MKKVIIIVGPTGSGKTELSLNLYDKIESEIISADSMQIYKKMDIGTAKADYITRNNYIHHMIDIINIGNNYSVSDFQKNTLLLIENILSQKKIHIIVGGTGLYINSIVYKLNFADTSPNENIRKELWNDYENKGQEYILNIFKLIDSESYNSIDHNNIKRILRAIEVFIVNKNKYSTLNKQFRQFNDDYDFYFYGLTDSRDKIYERINDRVDKMIEKGLFEEVKSLMAEYDINSQAFKAIGYKEVIEYYQNMVSFSEAVEKLKQNSRKYAKRQFTWFNRDPRIKWLNLQEFNYDFNEISNYILKDVIDE